MRKYLVQMLLSIILLSMFPYINHVIKSLSPSCVTFLGTMLALRL